MSKLKTPREKKLASLALDRRNTYRENNKSSRKNIPKSKQRSHQAERRAVNQPLKQLVGPVTEDLADQAEATARIKLIEKHRKAFTKDPDASLKDFLELQGSTREWRQERPDNWRNG